MFRKLLVGLDGSETSWWAFRRALGLAAEQGGELWVVSVEEHLPHFAGTIDEVQEEHEHQNAYFCRIQDQAQALADGEGVVLHRRTLAGRAADCITAMARAEGFDLVVLGHRGHSGPWRRLTGSTADRVVDRATCCVLVERPPAPARPR
jgi:nucleotide-binding universal stress UspA family protein